MAFHTALAASGWILTSSDIKTKASEGFPLCGTETEKGKTLARELKNFRKALGRSQKSFGQIIRVSRATIAPAETMQKLSRIVTLSLDQALRDGKLRMKTKPNKFR